MANPVVVAASRAAAELCLPYVGAGTVAAVEATEVADFSALIVVVGDPVWLSLVEPDAMPRGAQGPEWFARQLEAAGVNPGDFSEYDFGSCRMEIPSGRVPVTITRIDDLPCWPGAPDETVSAGAARTLPEYSANFAAANLSADDVEEAFAPTRFHRRFLRRFYQVRRIQTLRAKWTGRPSSDEVYFFQHIPKTAGMSVFHHCNAHLGWNDELVHLDARADAEVRRLGLPLFNVMDARELARIRLVFGHEVTRESAAQMGGRPIRWITCLRDPAERLVSHYNWEMEQRTVAGQSLEDFERWLAKQRNNWITHWLHDALVEAPAVSEEAAFQTVCRELDGFWLVADTKDFDVGMRRLTDALDLPPIARRTNVAGETYPRRCELTDALRERIYEAHPFDVKLLEKARAIPAPV